MTVLLTMREDIAGLKGEELDSISKNWIFLLNKINAEFVLCPNLLSISKLYIDRYNISKIVLTGGGDVFENFIENETKRQTVENYLIEISILKKIPLFGICRGMQVINKYFGGSKKLIEGHSGTFHEISLLNTEKVSSKSFIVNSFHDEGITLNSISADLEVTALSNEKLVEAFSHKKFSIFGQMWHPERKTPNLMANDFFFEFLGSNFKK